MKLSIANQSNYLAKIVQIEEEDFSPHENADRLKTVKIDYNNVITGINAESGVYVYFPTECAISEKFLSETNSYRDVALNVSDTEAGFFERHGRVKAMKLRGEYSQGYIVPVTLLEEIYGQVDFNFKDVKSEAGLYFDTIGDELLCWKYEPKPSREQGAGGNGKKKLKGNRIKDIIVEDQFKFHYDTPHLARELHAIDLDEVVTVTRKRHGSSLILANVLVKKKRNFFQRIYDFLNGNTTPTEYGIVWSSGKPRSRVPKGLSSSTNEWKTSNESYYTDNIWKRAYEMYEHALEEGITVYGEITGTGIQGAGYTYGQDYAVHIYRVTHTNPQGETTEFSWDEVKEYCWNHGFDYVEEYENDVPFLKERTHEYFLEYLTYNYIDKSYPDCKVDEGICVRQGDRVFKLKSPKFVVGESKALDTATEIVE